MVVLYTTHCPKCTILAKKLEMAGINYEECTSTKEMMAKGIQSVPMLGISKDSILPFSEAVKWVNKQEKGE